MQLAPPGRRETGAIQDVYLDTVDVRGTHAAGSVPADEVDLWQMRRWASGAYEIG